MTLPVDFVVLGVPASSQAGTTSKRRWKGKVTQAARDALPPDTTPTEEDVEIVIVYYHEGAPLDVDNMIKPIQDALCGVVYKDDAQVSDTRGSRRDIDGRFEVRGLPAALASGFTSGQPFVYVTVRQAPDHSRLIP